MATVVSQTLPLELLSAGDSGIVADVYGPNALVHRLQEMGLQHGARIRMVKPGSPCILEINHHRISIRLDETTSILVDVAR